MKNIRRIARFSPNAENLTVDLVIALILFGYGAALAPFFRGATIGGVF